MLTDYSNVRLYREEVGYMLYKSDDLIRGLYKNQYERMLRIAYRMLGDLNQAQDIVQDVFLQALFHQDQLIEHPNPEGWLIVTLRNLIQNERRKLESHPKVSIDDIIDLSDKETEIPLDAVLPLALPLEDRNILIWRFEQGLSYQEIANYLGISESGCRSRVSRAISRCRKLMKKRQLQ